MDARLAEALAAFQHGDLDRARALAEQALEQAPKPALVQHLLGLIDCRAGRIDRGITWLQAALEAEPDNAAFRLMLVRALVDASRAQEALAAAPPPAGTSPPELALWQARAEAASAAGDLPAAEQAWGRLAGADPTNPGLRLAHAQSLSALDRHEEAFTEFGEAARLVGSSLEADGGLLALAAPDGHGAPDLDSVRKLGLLLERTNRMDLLDRLLDQAEAHGIERDRLGYLAAASALRRGEPDEAQRLLLTEPPESDPSRWHRLMARIADALGDSARAFAEAEAMNCAVPGFDQWRERGAAYRRRLRAMAATITPEWAARLSPCPPGPRRSPAFLVGFPRSGTTLLDTFLMGHPAVAVVEERPMLAAAEALLGPLAGLPDRSPAELERARAAYFEELDRHVDRAFGGLVVDKLPLNLAGLPFIHCLFPDAAVIFAQRHPADAVLSGFTQSFVLNDAMACFLDIADAADLYDAALSLFTRAREALPITVHTLAYELLVADPGAALRPLVGALGLEWDAGLLDHQRTARERGAILTPSYDQVVQPLSKAPSGRWVRYRAGLAPVLPVLLRWAERLGY